MMGTRSRFMKRSIKYFNLILFMCGIVLMAHSTEATELSPTLKGVKRIAFFGDSLTDGSNYPDYVVNTLNRLHPEAGYELFNAAICGDTSTDLVRRLEVDVLALRPDLVVIGIGTNDALGKMEPEQYRENMTMLIRSIQEHKAKVLLILPSPMGDEKREEKLLAFIQVLRELAVTYDLPVADAHGLFQQWAKDGKSVVGSDGVHHGPDGFACMGRAVLDGLGYVGVPMETTIRPKSGLLEAWETSSPVPKNKSGEYDLTEAVSWRPYLRDPLLEKLGWADAPFVARGAWMPFDGLPSKDQVAFGRSYFEAPAAGVWRMEVGGSPKPLIVWVNGQKVWSSSRLHGYHPNVDRFPVKLVAGKNEIIVVSRYMTFVGLYPISPES